MIQPESTTPKIDTSRATGAGPKHTRSVRAWLGHRDISGERRASRDGVDARLAYPVREFTKHAPQWSVVRRDVVLSGARVGRQAPSRKESRREEVVGGRIRNSCIPASSASMHTTEHRFPKPDWRSIEARRDGVSQELAAAAQALRPAARAHGALHASLCRAYIHRALSRRRRRSLRRPFEEKTAPWSVSGERRALSPSRPDELPSRARPLRRL